MEKRYLKPVNAWAISFGCIIGWGSFVIPGATFLPLAGTAGTAIALGIGMVFILNIAFNFHSVMNRCEKSGNVFSYAKDILGYDHSFLCIWSIIMTYLSLLWTNSNAFILLFRSIFGTMFQQGFYYIVAGYDLFFGEILVILGVIFFFGIFTQLDKRIVALTNTIFAFILFAGVTLCFVLFIVKLSSLNFSIISCFKPFFATSSVNAGHPLKQILNVVTYVPWAFVGFEVICFGTRKFNFSKKYSMPIMTIAIICGGLVYIIMTLLSSPLLSENPQLQTIIARMPSHPVYGVENVVFLNVVSAILGKPGVIILKISMFAAVSTSLLCFFSLNCHIFNVLSEDKVFPLFLRKGKKRNQTEQNKISVFLVIAVSIFAPFMGLTILTWLNDVCTVCACITYAYISLCCIIAGKNENNTFLHCSGFSGFVVSIVLFFFPFIQTFWNTNAIITESYLILAIWGIAGFFLFRLVFQSDTQNRFGRSPAMWIIMLFIIFFSSTMWMRQIVHERTEKTIENISRFHMDMHEVNNLPRHDSLEKNEKKYIEFQVSSIQQSILKNTVLQLFLFILCLYISFNIFSNQLKREKKIYQEKMRSEESSRAKTTFLSNMSHDMRTPMNAIIGYTKLAQDKNLDAAKIHYFLDKIEFSSKFLLELINDVLEMSRIESGRMEIEPVPCNLKTVFDEAYDMFEIQMRYKNIKYIVDTSSVKNFYVLCDKNRLNRILLNLISNAYKFTEENGRVCVKLSQPKAESGDYVISIKDNGIGMSSEFAAKVFNSFERERSVASGGIQGTGLGTAITKKIVDLMGGTIIVKTEKGKGTEFIIKLNFPVVEKELYEKMSGAENSANRNPAVQNEFEGKRVLLVDDVEMNREIAMLILKAKGFIVETAENGKEAVQKVEENTAGYYDAIFMDVQMPVMDGYEASKAIRRLPDSKKAETPIIAMTANVFTEDVKKALDCGMNAHISKPVDINQIIKTLRGIL